jgi:hypothetical protein
MHCTTEIEFKFSRSNFVQKYAESLKAIKLDFRHLRMRPEQISNQFLLGLVWKFVY